MFQNAAIYVLKTIVWFILIDIVVRVARKVLGSLKSKLNRTKKTSFQNENQYSMAV